MKERTVREIGGEIWATLTHMQSFPDENSKLIDLDIHVTHEFCDVAMGILARYVDYKIINDEGLPVEPLEDRINPTKGKAQD